MTFRSRRIIATAQQPVENLNKTLFNGWVQFFDLTNYKKTTAGTTGARGPIVTPLQDGEGTRVSIVDGQFATDLTVSADSDTDEYAYRWLLSDGQQGEFNLSWTSPPSSGAGSDIVFGTLWPPTTSAPKGTTPITTDADLTPDKLIVGASATTIKTAADGAENYVWSMTSATTQGWAQSGDAQALQIQNNLNDLGNVSESQRALEMWDNFVSHYSQLIYSRNGASLIGHWPLYGNSRDYSFNGAATSESKIVTGLSGPIGGNTYFNGEQSNVNVQNITAGLFDGSAGTLSFWIEPYNRAYLQTSTHGPRLIWFTVDANNWLNIQSLTSNDLIYCSYRAGGVNSDRFITISDGDPHMISITWNKTADEVKVYLDAVQQGATLTGLGTWSGVPSTMFIGRGVDGERFWNGWIHSVELHNTALTLADFQARAAMKRPGYALPTYRHIRCYGDSITFGTGATNDDGWVELTSNTLRTTEDALYLLDNYGRGGNTAGDIKLRVQQDTYLSGLDTITIMLGMNDYAQQTALATFRTELTDIVQACKPRASKVLLVNIPFTTLNEAITRAQYNAEVAAVATAESVTLVDVSSAYGAAQVPDGTHPNDEGHAILAGIIGGAILT